MAVDAQAADFAANMEPLFDPIDEPADYSEDESEGELLPTFVYTPSGIYEVPNKYIIRDHDEAVYVTAPVWRQMRGEHSALNANAILNGQQLCASNIVCLADKAAPLTTGGDSKVLWFVRVAVSGGSPLFDHPFGSGFLWQLPHGLSKFFTKRLKEHEDNAEVAEYDGSSLLKSLSCTLDDFKPQDWPALIKVGRIDNYYDAVFAMACRPEEATIPCKRSLARPASMQPGGGRVYFDSTVAPDDAMTSVIETTATNLIKSNSEDDFRELLKLRLVNQQWKGVVESVIAAHYAEVLDLVKRAIESGAVPDIIRARDAALDSGLAVLAMVLDSIAPLTFMSYLRVRAGKRAGSSPHALSETPVEESGEVDHVATPVNTRPAPLE